MSSDWCDLKNQNRLHVFLQSSDDLSAMEILKKVPMREVNRVCRDATEKALQELVHSRKFIEFISDRRIKQAKILKAYQRLCILLSCLLILSVGFYWFSCFDIPSLKPTPQVEEPPIQRTNCSLDTFFPMIEKPKEESNEEAGFLSLWKIVEQYNKQPCSREEPKLEMSPRPMGINARTPWSHLCITMAEALYDRCVLFIQHSYYSGYVLDLTRQLPMTNTDTKSSKYSILSALFKAPNTQEARLETTVHQEVYE